MRTLVLIALVGCGRLAFEPNASQDSAVNGDTPGDQQADGSIDPALLFHLSFDAGIHDDARGHTVACINTCPPVVAGHVGAGSVVLSNGQCLMIPDASDLHPAVYTFSLWAAVFVPSQNAELIARPFNSATSSFDTFEAWVQPDSGVVILGNGVQSLTTSLDVTLWHHYAGVFDGTSLISYVDGAAVDTRPAGTSMYGPDPYLVGCDRDNGVEVAPMNGNFDEVRFYDRALTASEVATLAGL